MTTPVKIEFEEHPCKQGLNGVVGKSTTKDMISSGLMENILKL